MEKKSTRINLNKLIYPYFAVSGKNKKEPVKSFPGVFRFSIANLLKDIEQAHSLGIDKILLFGVPQKKDRLAREAYRDGNIVASAVKEIKKEFPDLTVITDVCLCAYASHGHCRILDSAKKVNKEKTLDALAKAALSYAHSGADWVAPSAMADNQVRVIRQVLDKEGLNKVKIMGYSAKFASNFYGPFRNAAKSAPAFADRSGYQLSFEDAGKALEKISADIDEGADIVMVKPALAYLDIIKEAKLKFDFPLAVYNTSGEYAFVKYGVKAKLWEERKVVEEIITSLTRAGSDFIITYHAKDIAKWQSGKD